MNTKPLNIEDPKLLNLTPQNEQQELIIQLLLAYLQGYQVQTKDKFLKGTRWYHDIMDLETLLEIEERDFRILPKLEKKRRNKK